MVTAAGWPRLAVAAAFLAIFAAVAAGSYVFFLGAFRYVLAEPLVGPVIGRYLLEASFAVIFALGTASFVVAAPAMFFGGSDVRLLAGLPVDPGAIFFHRFAAAILLSSWPLAVVGIPAIWALGAAAVMPLPYYVATLPLIILFALTIGAAGGLLSFAIAALTGRLSTWARFDLGAVLGIGFTAVAARAVVPHGLFALFTAGDAAQADAAFERVRRLFAWWPSQPFVDAVSVAADGLRADAGRALFMIAAALIAAFVALALLAHRAYLPLWRQREERVFLARPADVRGRAKLRRPFPRYFRWRHSFLFEKDAIVFSRSPDELARAGLLLALLVLYVLAARSLTSLDFLRTPELFSTVVAFAFAAIGYFALTFALRFVFPAFSLEGRSAWVLWSSPVHLHELFSWKFFFWSTLLMTVLETVAYLTVWLFDLPFVLAAYFLFAVACATFSAVAVALAFGTAFPSFRDRDPDSLSTSVGGLLTTAVGLTLVAVYARYVRSFTLTLLTTGSIDVVGVFGMLIVAAAAVGIAWAIGPRSMDLVEFPS